MFEGRHFGFEDDNAIETINTNKPTIRRIFLRFLHASPNAPTVDILVNGKIAANNLRFGKFTAYKTFGVGKYLVQIYAANDRKKPVFEKEISSDGIEIGTVAVINLVDNLNIKLINDETARSNRRLAKVRVIHLSPNAPAVDISTLRGRNWFRNVKYTEVTNYIEVSPRRYTVQVSLSDRRIIVLTVPGISLNGGKNYSLYIIGLAGENVRNPLQIKEALDGSSYLK